MMTTRRWRVLSEPLHPPFDGSRAAELPILAATDADLVTADSIAEWMDRGPNCRRRIALAGSYWSARD